MPLEALKNHKSKIAVIGLGYVGLPLAVEFARQYRVLGFDINAKRIAQLEAGKDITREVEPDQLAAAKHLQFSSDEADLDECNVYIVTVPTPIDNARRPDLRPLIAASQTVGRHLSPGNTVIYESTVYPGCTEEDCVPILEQISGLVAAFEQGNERFPVSGFRFPENQNHGNAEGEPSTGNRKPETGKRFFVGYSPERINPGDKAHGVTTITKVTSGSTPEAADFVDALYASIVTAGTHKAPSIRTAEAAKVIENTQRDVNIALVNELSLIFTKLGIDTEEVLDAAASKWNFLPFRPGLVGGHCIGVDPYYLTHKAQEIGYHPEMILAGRRINDRMGGYVAGRVAKLMTQKCIHVVGSRILLLGFAFKENCPDLRNTRVIDTVRELGSYHAAVDVYDPWIDPAEARHEYGIEPLPRLNGNRYDAVIVAVGHRQFREMGAEHIRNLLKPDGVLFDIKGILPASQVDGRL